MIQISNVAEVDQLQSAWQCLDDSVHGPIEQFDWSKACANDLANGGVCFYALVKNGRIHAVAPLEYRNRFRAESIGVKKLKEPMDFVYADRESLQELCRGLVRQGLAMELPRIRADSPVIAELQSAIKGRGYMHLSRATPYPYISIDSSWVTPESHFNAGRRSDFRRAHRHAEKLGITTYEVLKPSPDQLAPILEEAYAAELNGWKGRRGTALSVDQLRSVFYRKYLEASSAKGALTVALMRIAGRVVAMQLDVEARGRLWMLKIGYDESYAKASPGTLLMLHVLRYAAERQLESIEFLGAAESWTELWTTQLRECVRVRLFPWSVAGLISFGADTLHAARARVRRVPVTRKRSLRRLVGAAVRRVFGYLADAYIVGPEMGDALATHNRYASRGYATAIGYFNAIGEEPRRVADTNMELLAALGHTGYRGYVSIKAPAMKFDMQQIERIAVKSKEVGVGIHFDSHAMDTADATFAAVDVALRYAPAVGCTLPGCWSRSVTDAQIVVKHGLRARVVKGQWPDPAHPDADPHDGFMRVVDALAGRARAVAVATHDPDLARWSLTRLLDARTACELELLYGLPMNAAAVARELQVPIRVYLPFGAAYLPYALDQLRRHPGTAWWLVKDALSIVGRGLNGSSRVR